MRLDQLFPSIGDLRADDVQAYLRSHGWVLVPDPRASVAVYANERGDEVVVPLRRDFIDYARRLGEMVETLMHTEGRVRRHRGHPVRAGVLLRLRARRVVRRRRPDGDL